MLPSEALSGNFMELLKIVREYPMFTNPRITGSCERCEEKEGDDLDIYVDADESATLFEVGDLIEDLKDKFGLDISLYTSKTHLVRIQTEEYLGDNSDDNN